MSLRAFILLMSFAVVATISAVFYLQTEGTLGRMFHDLEIVHSKTIVHTAESILQARQFSLRTYRVGLEHDNTLSRELLIAKEHGDSVPLPERLKKVSAKWGLDLVDLVYFDHRGLGDPKLAEKNPILLSALKGRSGFVIGKSGHDDLTLISFSPLRNYGEIVAVVVLGYAFNRQIAKDIAKTTQARVQFISDDQTAPISPLNAGPIPIRLENDDLSPLLVRMQISGDYILNLNQSTRANIMKIGAGSLLMVFLLISFLLEFGFVRRFRQLLHSIGDVAKNLDKGLVAEVASIRHPIREVNNLSQSFGKFSHSLSQFRERIEEQSKREAWVQVAEQVAHDLKSPVSALDMMLEDESLKDIPEQRRDRVRLCLERIKDTLRLLSSSRTAIRLKIQEANRQQTKGLALGRSGVSAGEPAEELGLVPVLDEIITEKRYQYRERAGIKFSLENHDSDWSLYVRLRASDFRRALSNLIDNAVQAIETDGRVTLNLSRHQNEKGNEVRIVIEDSGKGIPAEMLSKIGKRGATFGKTQGSGLGLWSAIQTMEAAGGNLYVTSQSGKGTQIEIRLPLCAPPAWSVDDVDLRRLDYLVILDDDPAIHDLWRQKCSRHGINKLSLECFQDGEKFSQWVIEHRTTKERSLFLVDYQLGSGKRKGTEWIENLGIEHQSALVTSLWQKPELQQWCKRFEVRLLPKERLRAIQISTGEAPGVLQ